MVWAQVSTSTGLARPDRLLDAWIHTAWPMDDAARALPRLLAPDDEDYPGDPRYLVRWTFRLPSPWEGPALEQIPSDELSTYLSGKDPFTRTPVAPLHERHSERESLLMHLLHLASDLTTRRNAGPE